MTGKKNSHNFFSGNDSRLTTSSASEYSWQYKKNQVDIKKRKTWVGGWGCTTITTTCDLDNLISHTINSASPTLMRSSFIARSLSFQYNVLSHTLFSCTIISNSLSWHRIIPFNISLWCNWPPIALSSLNLHSFFFFCVNSIVIKSRTKRVDTVVKLRSIPSLFLRDLSCGQTCVYHRLLLILFLMLFFLSFFLSNFVTSSRSLILLRCEKCRQRLIHPHRQSASFLSCFVSRE